MESGPEFEKRSVTLGSALTPNLLLTPTQLSTHLACAHYTQLERKRRAGELEIEFMPDLRLEAMRSRGEQHERAYIERLRLAGSSIVDLGESRDPHATLAAMREVGSGQSISLCFIIRTREPGPISASPSSS